MGLLRIEEIQARAAEVPTLHLLRERARELERWLKWYSRDTAPDHDARLFELDAVRAEIRHREGA